MVFNSASALVLTNDVSVVSMLTESLDELAVSICLCATEGEAVRMVHRRKFEAVMVDIFNESRRDFFLDQVRESTSNRNAVTFVISGGQSISKQKAMYSLAKPLSREFVNKTLICSFGMIMRERRRYFRCPTFIPALLSLNAAETINSFVTNVSEGGTALSTEVRLGVGSHIAVQFDLPGRSILKQNVNCEVCWYDDSSKTAGVRFLGQSETGKAELQNWLARRLECHIPPRVLEKFRTTFPDKTGNPVELISNGGTLPTP